MWLKRRAGIWKYDLISFSTQFNRKTFQRSRCVKLVLVEVRSKICTRITTKITLSECLLLVRYHAQSFIFLIMFNFHSILSGLCHFMVSELMLNESVKFTDIWLVRSRSRTWKTLIIKPLLLTLFYTPGGLQCLQMASRWMKAWLCFLWWVAFKMSACEPTSWCYYHN